MITVILILILNVVLSVSQAYALRVSPRYRAWHQRMVDRCFYAGFALTLKLRRRRLGRMHDRAGDA